MLKIREYKLGISDEHKALSPTSTRALQEEKKRAVWEKEKQQRQRKVELAYTKAQSLMAHRDEMHIIRL